MMEAVVEFEYKAQQRDELTLAVGDIISNIRKDEGGWWQGELAGRRGLFPDNFVREIKRVACPVTKTKKPNDVSQNSSAVGSDIQMVQKGEDIRRRWCTATFSYTPRHEDELGLKSGDVIEIMQEVEEGWWQGCLNGKMGMFPSNFTREFTEEAEDQAGCPNAPETCSGTGVKLNPETQSKEPDCGTLRLMNSDETQPEQLRAPMFGGILKDKHSPCSMNRDGGVEKVQETTNAKTVGKVKVDEVKPGIDIQKHGRPAIPPKKPLIFKQTKLLGQSATDSAKPPQKPEKSLVASIQSGGGNSMPKQGGLDQHIEVEDFDSIVMTSEKLNHLTTSRPRVTERRPCTQVFRHITASCPDLSDAPKAEEKDEEQRPTSKKALDIRLLLSPKPALIPPSGASSSHGPDAKSRSESVSMEELRTQLRDLRGAVELMGIQHKKEIKQLMNELDEEKKIRLSLQMEVAHIKKTLSK